ncbi:MULTISPECIES: hypothetical protein [unclassified Streptomyces]
MRRPRASAHADELLALPSLPTVFFGHSMGAAVAAPPALSFAP